MNLKVAVIFLQSQCQMKCPFCITEDGFSRLTIDSASDLFFDLKSKGVKNVVLGGGEPTLSPHFLPIIHLAKKNGFHVQVGTNGIVWLNGLEKNSDIDRFVLPLESIDAEIHDTIRVFSRSHHAVILDRLEKLRRAKKSVTISTIVTKPNLESVVGVGQFLEDYFNRGGLVHAWHIYKFLPQGRGGRAFVDELKVADSEYERVYSQAVELQLPFKVFKRKDMYQSKEVDFFWFEKGQLRRGWQGEIKNQPPPHGDNLSETLIASP